MELHIIPDDELHNISVDCDCPYEVMGFSNGTIVIHQSNESSVAMDAIMSDLGIFRDYSLYEVIE